MPINMFYSTQKFLEAKIPSPIRLSGIIRCCNAFNVFYTYLKCKLEGQLKGKIIIVIKANHL
jgi:hypothetical protein